MTDLLNELIEAGEDVKAIHFQHGWVEFDMNEDYEKICQWAKDGSLEQVIKVD